MKITLEPGLDQTLSLIGHNFMYRSGEGDIRVVLMENDSTVIHEEILRVGQDLVGSPSRFEKVRVTNLHDNTQEIEFATGSMQLVDTTGGSVVNVGNIENPQKYFSNSNQQIAYSVNTAGPVAVVSPSANVNGLIIYQYYVTVANNNQHQSSIILNSLTPTGNADGCVLAFDYGYETMGVGSGNAALPLFVRSGQGLYFYGLNHNAQSVIYEVL